MLFQRTSALLATAALVAVAAACGGSPPPPPAEPPPPPKKSAPQAQQTAPPGHLARGSLEHVLAQGPPWILQRVPVEEVVRGGNFVGWKILALPEAWHDAQIKVGDVVTKVNGQGIERPDDLFAVWKALVTAKELRIAYEREGAERELVMPIAGEPSPDLVKTFERGSPPPRRPSRKPGVTVIEEDDGSPPLGDMQE